MNDYICISALFRKIKSFKHIFIGTFFFSFLFAGAQKNGLLSNKKWYLKAAVNYGFIMQHRATIGHLITSYVPMAEIDLVKPSDGSKMWHLENNKPDIGMTFTFLDFGNPKVLGHGYAIAPFIEIPLNKKEKASRLIFRTAWGLAYMTKRFDIRENHKNIAIGSNWDAFVQFRFQWNINLTQKFRIEPGFGISHVSNGRMQVPNLGLNLITLNLGLTYKLSDPKTEITKIDSSTKVPSRNELLVWGAAGVNEKDPPGGNKLPAYTLSFNYFYNVRNTHKVGAGLDLYYEESHVKDLEVFDYPHSTFSEKMRAGIKFAYSYNVGRISFPIEMGYYFYSPYNDDGPLFHRFGVRYTGSKGLFLQFGMKSHWIVAYHFDLGVGYRIPLKKKNT